MAEVQLSLFNFINNFVQFLGRRATFFFVDLVLQQLMPVDDLLSHKTLIKT